LVRAQISRLLGPFRMLDKRADPLLDFIIKGSFASFVTRVVGVALSYVSAVVLSRTLGVQGYGVYSVALAWALVLVLPCRAGLDFAALRFGPAYIDAGDQGRLRGLARFAVVTMLALSALVGGAVYLLSVAGMTRIPAALAPGVALLIFPLAALALVAVLLRTARLIVASQLYEQVLRPTVLISLIAGGAIAGLHLSPANAMMITALSAFVALTFGTFHVIRALGPAEAPRIYSPWREWLALSLPLFFTMILQEVLNQLDIIMLGYLGSPSAAGLYSAAWRLASLVSFGLAALTISSGPLIASANAAGNLGELARIARITATFSFAASVVLALPLVLAGHQILGLFGAGFRDGYPALLILLAGGLTNGLTGVVAYFLTLTGHQLQALLIFACAAIISLSLNILLIPHFSIVGAAIASVSATVFWNLAMVVQVRRTMGINSVVFGRFPRRWRDRDEPDALASPVQKDDR